MVCGWSQETKSWVECVCVSVLKPVCVHQHSWLTGLQYCFDFVCYLWAHIHIWTWFPTLNYVFIHVFFLVWIMNQPLISSVSVCICVNPLMLCVCMKVGIRAIRKLKDFARLHTFTRLIWHAKAKPNAHILKIKLKADTFRNTSRTLTHRNAYNNSHTVTQTVHSLPSFSHTLQSHLHSLSSCLPFCAKLPVRLSSSPILTLCGSTMASVWRNWLQSHQQPLWQAA